MEEAVVLGVASTLEHKQRRLVGVVGIAADDARELCEDKDYWSKERCSGDSLYQRMEDNGVIKEHKKEDYRIDILGIVEDVLLNNKPLYQMNLRRYD